MSQELKIICPFCDAPYDATMEAKLDFSMGSEYTGIYGETVGIKIFCTNCGKLVYTKGNIL